MAYSHKKIGLIFVALLVLAVLFFVSESRLSANAGQPSGYGNDNIIVMPLEMGSDKSGFAIVDVKLSKIMIYEIGHRRGGSNKLRLVAVRNFSYDSLLEQYNNAEPTPEMLQKKFFSSDAQKEDLGEPSKEDIKELITAPQD